MKFICKTAVLGWAAALLLAALSAGAGQTYAAERFIQKISPETGFEQGMKQAKDWKTAHPDGQLIVEFADGFYPLEETWKLDPSWNGTADAPTVCSRVRDEIAALWPDYHFDVVLDSDFSD